MSNYIVTNPATGETVFNQASTTDAEVSASLASADSAYRTWSRSTSVAERAALMQRVAELHTERRELLADIIVREMGKPVEQALGEVDFSAAIYSYYAENGEKFLAKRPTSCRPAGCAPQTSCCCSMKRAATPAPPGRAGIVRRDGPAGRLYALRF